MDDYRVRHPIILAEEPQAIDVFPVDPGRRLDSHSAAQIQEFASSYRQFGQGPINVLLPVGPRQGVSEATRDGIRRALAGGGAAAPVSFGTYPIGDANLAAPIRLSFTKLKAKVAHQCGEWPTDLASGSSIQGWENKPYWNFGCAYQTAIAAQVADPRDLVTPQAETPADTARRIRGIEGIRKGADPGTDWKIKNSAISSVGAN
jgi:pilus assembly protein CpaD